MTDTNKEKKADLSKMDGAYEELTGRRLGENNTSNVFGQMDRAWRQSTDEKLKKQIAKALGFSYDYHNEGPRTRTR